MSSDRDLPVIAAYLAKIRLFAIRRRILETRMFELTSRAAAALTETHAMNGPGERAAIRISMMKPSGTGSSAGYQLRFASRPLPDDVVVEQNGTSVFLASGVADRLEGSVLDVADTRNGPRLVLKHRPTA